MLGVKEKANVVYLIDFGLSKRYWDSKHINMKQKIGLTGNARYASINTLKGYEQSRRDDLEAIGYMLMYFLRGMLPWSGLEAKTKQEKYKLILRKKETFPLDDLCEGFPKVFQLYLQYARKLSFMDRPEYDMLQERFQKY